MKIVTLQMSRSEELQLLARMGCKMIISIPLKSLCTPMHPYALSMHPSMHPNGPSCAPHDPMHPFAPCCALYALHALLMLFYALLYTLCPYASLWTLLCTNASLHTPHTAMHLMSLITPVPTPMHPYVPSYSPIVMS